MKSKYRLQNRIQGYNESSNNKEELFDLAQEELDLINHRGFSKNPKLRLIEEGLCILAYVCERIISKENDDRIPVFKFEYLR